MTTIKVCGFGVVSAATIRLCLATVAVTCLSGCTTSANIPYQQTLYKITYNYLRTAECLNQQSRQIAFEDCSRSYAQDYHSYKQLRESFVKLELDSSDDTTPVEQ